MWLKEAIEKQYLSYLKEFYNRSDRRFMLREGLQTYPSYVNPSRFHMAGYVKKSYNENGTTYIELETSNGKTVTITAPMYTDYRTLEFESVLCEGVVEHINGIVDNTVFMRTCSSISIL